MSDSLKKAFNDQIAIEFAASYLYLQIAADFEARNLPGFANWMRGQAEEERGHALRFYDFLIERGVDVRLQPIQAPDVDVSSPLAAFEHVLEHEREVTRSINDLYRQANDEGDYASVPLLQWFVTEQVEEEAAVSQIVERLRLAGDESSALLILDHEVGTRRPEGA
ncbi:MAG: ferritin [Nitriliruptorales bacterium]